MTELLGGEQLGNLALITMGQSPAPGSCDDIDHGMPFLQGCAEFGNQHPESKSFCHAPLKVAKASSTLISVRAPVGTTNRADRDYCIGRGLAAILARGVTENNDFLQYAVEQNVGFLHRHSQGSTFLAISSRDLHQMKVPHPQRVVQDKIADILLTIDGAIHHTDVLIEKHKQIKTGLMHDLFTRGLDSSGKLRPLQAEAPELYYSTPKGQIPLEWCCSLLDEVAHRGSGHTPSKSFPEYWNGGIKWISLADCSALDRVYISDTENHISGLGVQNSSAVIHPPGIVVLSRDAGVGKSAITTDNMAVSQHFMCWQPGPRLNTHYLYYWLQYRKRDFENIATGSTIPTIGLRFFKKYKICVPKSIVEQRKIGLGLLNVDLYLFSLEKHLAKLRRIRSGLMNDLLNGYVSVRVGNSQDEIVDV